MSIPACTGQGVGIPECTGQGGVSKHALDRGVSAQWGVCPGAGVFPGQGVCQGGVYPNMHWDRHPPVDRMTDRCKNITLPQLRCGR